MPSLLRSLVLLAPLATGCSSKWSVVDGDGDGVSLADGDCWDAAEGPPGSSLTGADIYPGAPDAPYDGFDADCAGNDDYDIDGDGFVTDEAHVGLTTYGVPETGLATAAGDCWDDPSATPEDFVAINGFDEFTADSVHPGADDIFYDGVDSACDGGDEFDADGDGFASSSYPDRDGNVGDDCFDLDEPGYDGAFPEDVNIRAQEVCDDEIDNDCDSLIDAEDEDAAAVSWYVDADADGFGDLGASGDGIVDACEQPKGYVRDRTDCDDSEATTYPDAPEACDAVDNDCNGVLDDDYAKDAPTWYLDSDSDGYGDPVSNTVTCYQPSGYVSVDFALDCDDTSNRTFPGAAFLDSPTDCMEDDDGDGYGDDSPPSGVTLGSDCDDVDNTIFPGATEIPGDEVDQDCDTLEECYVDDDDDGYRLTDILISTDIDCTDSGEGLASDPTGECDDSSDTTYPGAAFNESSSSCRKDDDGDGYGDSSAPSGVTDGTDCDDTDSAINTAATEGVGDNVDQDCDNTELCYVDDDNDSYHTGATLTSSDIDCNGDGEAEDSDPSGDCDDDSDTTYPGAAFNESSTSCRKDDDGDGYGDDDAPSGVTDGGDCDDDDSAINPSEAEIAGDNVDQDCDNSEECYVDDDDDGYRLTSTISSSNIDCTDPGEAEADDPTGDCDDSSDTTYPGAAFNESGTSCRNDDDGDGYGDDSPASGVTAGGDCNDTDSAINPSEAEIVGDNVDQDCDNSEECYVDDDDDGYRLTSTIASSNIDCTDPGEAEASDPTGDCDDSSDTTYPGAAPNDSATACMKDDDGDDYGDSSAPGGVTDGDDCDDTDSTINPSATEGVGDEVDQDCDGDELCYEDDDNDGYHTGGTVTSADIDCTDSGEARNTEPSGDCDDGSASTFPGAAPNDSTTACMKDDDDDNYGDSSAPSGVTDGTDCDDDESGINPGATEGVGDEIDQDCDNTEECYVDADNDGYHTGASVSSSDIDCTDSGEATDDEPSGDCNDTSAVTFPGAAPNDSGSACMTDSDGDDFGSDTPVSGATAGTDCDDGVSAINPDATEIVDDGTDQDCNNTELCYVDEDDDGYRLTSTIASSNLVCTDSGEGRASDPTGDCDDESDVTYPGAAYNESGTDCMLDDDGDGYGDDSAPSGVTDGTDCDDTDNTINPGATEGVDDGTDQDCDNKELCYADEDDDGYRLTSTVESNNLVCTDSGEGVSSDPTGDCDDESPETYPGAAYNESGTDCMLDADGDGYGDDSAPSGVTDGTDCDDGEDLKYPGADEVCLDGIEDNDCDNVYGECLLEDTDLTYADTIFEGSSGGDFLGYSVRLADVTDDGIIDVLIGARDADSVYLFEGPVSSGTFDAADADETFTGDAGTRTGNSISAAGDVNGDGDDDFLIGATLADVGSGQAGGAAYLVLGPATGVDLTTDADAALYSPNLNAYAGTSVALISDQVTSDGTYDILIGAPFEKDGGDNPGAAYIHLGLSSYSNDEINLTSEGSIVVLLGEADGDDAGTAVCGLDVSGDGMDDVFVGAPDASSGVGTAYLMLGPTTIDKNLSAADFAINGTSGSDLGASVAPVGDLDGDGYEDLLIGATGTTNGTAYLYYGAGTSVPTLQATFTGESSGNGFGTALSAGGDINGDGDDDLLITARYAGYGSTYLFYGPFSGSISAASADVILEGVNNGDQAGMSISGGQDVNADGLDDFLIGAHRSDPNGGQSGSAYLILRDE